jgi:hypothetical protein
MYFYDKASTGPCYVEKSFLLLYIHIKQLMQDQWKLSNVDKHMY